MRDAFSAALIILIFTMPRGAKRSTETSVSPADITSEDDSSKKRDSKKPKTPSPKKSSDIALTTRVVYYIRWCSTKFGLHLFCVVNSEDTNDAFLRRLCDCITGPAQHDLKSVHQFKGDVNRRVSLDDDSEMSNSRNRCLRKFVALCDEDATPRSLLAAANAIKVFLNQENPYRLNFEVDETCSNIDNNNGEGMGIVKPDDIVTNADVVRLMKMIYDIEGNWGDEYPDTVREFFHEQNLTVSVRDALGITISSNN